MYETLKHNIKIEKKKTKKKRFCIFPVKIGITK